MPRPRGRGKEDKIQKRPQVSRLIFGANHNARGQRSFEKKLITLWCLIENARLVFGSAQTGFSLEFLYCTCFSVKRLVYIVFHPGHGVICVAVLVLHQDFQKKYSMFHNTTLPLLSNRE